MQTAFFFSFPRSLLHINGRLPLTLIDCKTDLTYTGPSPSPFASLSFFVSLLSVYDGVGPPPPTLQYCMDDIHSSTGEENMNDDESMSVVPRGSSPPTTNPPSSRAPSQVRSRITVVCGECKRLKLKCDRRTPCSACVKRETVSRCIYSAAASEKIDVQSVHNQTVNLHNLLMGVCDFLGIPEDDMNHIMNAQSWPPSEDYQLPVNPEHMRAIMFREGAEHSRGRKGRRALSWPDSLDGRESGSSKGPGMVNTGAIVAFSKPSAQITNSSPPQRFGHVAQPVTTGRRAASAKALGASLMRTALDMTARIFQSNSSIVPSEFESGMRMWCEAMGWEARPRHPCGNSSGEPLPIEETRNVIPLLASQGELDYHDAPRPKDSNALILAHTLFVLPALSNSGALAFATQIPGHSGFPSPSASSATSTPSPTLVTPQHVLDHLPSKEWRSILWREFENAMITHEGVSGPGRSVWKRRIERMFEWADHMSRADRTSETGLESGSHLSSSSHSSLKGKSRTGTNASRGRGKNAPPDPPPPPTLAEYAVACAVYALGALSWACKTAHGFESPVKKVGDPHAMDIGGDDVSVASSGAAMPPPMSIPGGGGSSPAPFTFNLSMTGGDNPSASMGNNTAASIISGSTSSTVGPDPPAKEAQEVWNPISHPLPPSISPHTLHSLTRAALLSHDTFDLPPSLDYIHAHVLSWIYLLHPSDSLSSTTAAGFDSAVKGIAGGLVTVIEPTIWKDLGKCVNVARGMGLGVVDAEPDEGSSMVIDDDASTADKMDLYEREARRRVWWELSYFDLFISDALGHAPLIAEESAATCSIPSDVDESSFDPLSQTLPAPIPGGAAGQSLSYFIAKCKLITLTKELRRWQLKDPHTGELNMEAAHSFDKKLGTWKSQLPSRFNFTVGNTMEGTDFPANDYVAIQACDLQIRLHVLTMKLWYPFLRAFLSDPGSRPTYQIAAIVSATSSTCILVASQYLLTSYRTQRPMVFGEYSFGRAIWMAGVTLASTVIAVPHIIIADAARQGLNLTITLARDQVICGRTDASQRPKYEVLQLLEHLRMMADRVSVKPATGTKRKAPAPDHVETVKIREGFQIPYTGMAIISAEGHIDFVYGPEQTFKRSVIVGDNGPIVPVSSPAGSRTMPATRNNKRSAASAEHVVGGGNGSYVLPAAVNAGPSRAPRGRAPSVLSGATSSHASSLPNRANLNKARPVIGIRDRKTNKAPAPSSNSNVSANDKGHESSGSRTKRQKNDAGSAVSASSAAGPTRKASSNVGFPVNDGSMGPPSVSMPPPIQQTAPPQPTYFHAPSHGRASSSTELPPVMERQPYHPQETPLPQEYISAPSTFAHTAQDFPMAVYHATPAAPTADFSGAPATYTPDAYASAPPSAGPSDYFPTAAYEAVPQRTGSAGRPYDTSGAAFNVGMAPSPVVAASPHADFPPQSYTPTTYSPYPNQQQQRQWSGEAPPQDPTGTTHDAGGQQYWSNASDNTYTGFGSSVA